VAEALSRPFSVRLPTADIAQLDQLSRMTRRSRNALIAQAVEQFVTAEMDFIDAAQQATDEALAPGARRVPHEAVRAWLQTWGTPDEAEATPGLLEPPQSTESPEA